MPHGWQRGPTDKLPCGPEYRKHCFYPWDRSAIRGVIILVWLQPKAALVNRDSKRSARHASNTRSSPDFAANLRVSGGAEERMSPRMAGQYHG
jgi:hypothetical protein